VPQFSGSVAGLTQPSAHWSSLAPHTEGPLPPLPPPVDELALEPPAVEELELESLEFGMVSTSRPQPA
jgi:hypothetical protein